MNSSSATLPAAGPPGNRKASNRREQLIAIAQSLARKIVLDCQATKGQP